MGIPGVIMSALASWPSSPSTSTADELWLFRHSVTVLYGVPLCSTTSLSHKDKLPSSNALCSSATKLQYPDQVFPLYSTANLFSGGSSDQKLKFNRSMVKIKFTVASFFSLGCSSWDDQVSVEYAFLVIAV
jgi:hypothetical protein